MSTPFPSQQRIVDALHRSYGIEVVAFEFLPLGADRNAAVYKAGARDKKCYFVKLKRNYNHEISIAIAQLLHESGLDEIICPIKNIHGQHSQRLEDFTLIVYPFIEGQDGFSRDLCDDQWIMLGTALRQIHEIKVPLSMQNQIRRETYSDTWRNTVRSILIHVENPTNALARFMKENKEVIKKLVERSTLLAQKIKNQPSPPFVLCHSDMHGGNVLIDENNSIYIVDWDEPIMAPKERDLMFIGGGVGNLWNKPHEEAAFFQGYGNTHIDKAILAYYRLERVVEDIAEFWNATPMTDSATTRIYKLFTGMFEPNGVVDIALRT